MIVHLTETELADDIHTVLARVRDEGLEVIVERDHRPIAIIRSCPQCCNLLTFVDCDPK
jgi:hypothetical protein